MLHELSTVEIAKCKAAIAVACNLPHSARTKRARARDASLDLLFWPDLHQAALAVDIASHLDNYLAPKGNCGVWRVSAKQVAETAQIDIAVAIMALRLLGAHREAGLWTTWDGEILNPLQVVPASAFTGLQHV